MCKLFMRLDILMEAHIEATYRAAVEEFIAAVLLVILGVSLPHALGVHWVKLCSTEAIHSR
eukprot:8254628-Ditylum_brightwellii.AAC.1